MYVRLYSCCIGSSPLPSVGVCVFMATATVCECYHGYCILTKMYMCSCCSCLSQFMSLGWELNEARGGSSWRLVVGARRG